MPVVGSCQDAVLSVWLFDMRLFYIPEPPPVTMALSPVNSRAMLTQKWDGFVWMVLLFLLLRIKRATTKRENTGGRMGLSTYENCLASPCFLSVCSVRMTPQGYKCDELFLIGATTSLE